MGRAPCCEKVGLKKGRWTGEEDDILTKYIQANGEGSWRSLPKNAGLLRCGKSCRLRWINYLRYDLKRGNISSQEEDIIIKLHASLGNKWSLIASQLPGRTDNEIKNYWNSHLSRKIDTFRRPRSEPLPIIMNLGTKESKKKGGRTSRSAMKKNKTSHTTNNKIGKSSPEIVKESVVPLPSPPTLEKETLPRAIISRQEEQGEMEMRNLVMPTSYQEVGGEGMLGSSEEREIIVMSNDGEEREKRNLMLYCPTDDQESSELLGPQESLESGLLTFHDINTCSEEAEKNITMVSGDQERESGVVMSCISSNGDLSSNGESGSGGGGGGWFSCSSTTPYLENGRIGWEWGGFVLHENLWENGKDQEQEIEQEEMLSWLWDTSDNINGGGETQNLEGGIMDSEKHEALVTWLLS